MKKLFPFFLLPCILFFGCDNSSDKNEEVVYESVRDTVQAAGSEDSSLIIQSTPLLWSVTLEGNSQIEKLKKPADSKVDKMTAQEITNELNKTFDDIPLEFLKTSHDTAFVKITDSQKFTNQLGSTGAYNYMATVVYNLSEMKNIKFVNFDFKEGDHAIPGVYSREDFKNLR